VALTFRLKKPGGAQLKRLTKKLGKTRELIKVVQRAQAEEGLDLVQQGFSGEEDPYGKKWKDKKKPDGRKNLHGKTSRLRRGWTIRSDIGMALQASVDYSSHHQNPRRRGGKLKRPRRMQVPSAKRGMPRKWSKPLNEAAADAISELLGL
jgi:hypothetical protein